MVRVWLKSLGCNPPPERPTDRLVGPSAGKLPWLDLKAYCTMWGSLGEAQVLEHLTRARKMGIWRPLKFLWLPCAFPLPTEGGSKHHLEKHSSPRGHGKTGWAPPCPPQDPTKAGHFVRCSFNEPMVFLKQSAPWARGNNSLAGQRNDFYLWQAKSWPGV